MDIPPTAVRVQTCVLQCGCAHAGSVHNVRRSVRTHGAHLGRQVVVGGGRVLLGGGKAVRRTCFASKEFSSSVSEMDFVYVSIRSTSSVSWWVVPPGSGSPNQALKVFALPHVR